jgi:DNA (cytosine-5)-methyltransferase 1
MPTIPATCQHGLVEPFLVRYHGNGGAESVDRPLPTITTRDRFGLVQPMHLDIRLRMLQPHELAAAMSFPPGYRFAGTRSEVVKQIGNAVEVNTAAALCEAALGCREAT